MMFNRRKHFSRRVLPHAPYILLFLLFVFYLEDYGKRGNETEKRKLLISRNTDGIYGNVSLTGLLMFGLYLLILFGIV